MTTSGEQAARKSEKRRAACLFACLGCVPAAHTGCREGCVSHCDITARRAAPSTAGRTGCLHAACVRAAGEGLCGVAFWARLGCWRCVWATFPAHLAAREMVRPRSARTHDRAVIVGHAHARISDCSFCFNVCMGWSVPRHGHGLISFVCCWEHCVVRDDGQGRPVDRTEPDTRPDAFALSALQA